MSRVQIGKIYSRADGKLVYHKHVVILKQHPEGLFEGINVETNDAAFISSFVLTKFYKVEK